MKKKKIDIFKRKNFIYIDIKNFRGYIHKNNVSHFIVGKGRTIYSEKYYRLVALDNNRVYSEGVKKIKNKIREVLNNNNELHNKLSWKSFDIYTLPDILKPTGFDLKEEIILLLKKIDVYNKDNLITNSELINHSVEKILNIKQMNEEKCCETNPFISFDPKKEEIKIIIKPETTLEDIKRILPIIEQLQYQIFGEKYVGKNKQWKNYERELILYKKFKEMVDNLDIHYNYEDPATGKINIPSNISKQFIEDGFCKNYEKKYGVKLTDSVVRSIISRVKKKLGIFCDV